MKVVIAQMELMKQIHFSITTEWKHFGKNGPYLEKDVISEMTKTRTQLEHLLTFQKKTI